MTTDFGILGPLRALRDGAPLPLGGPRQRAVLARLLLDLRHVVPVEVLAEDVWDGAPPESATKTLQKHVWGVRQALGPGLVRTAGGGYALDADDDAVDARRFERLLAAGEAAAALALWRGPVLSDLPDLAFAAAERSRLEELRLVAVERSLEADLRAGRHDAVVPRLAELTERHPLRERLCGLLMLALYRSGRQAEALAAFQRHRRRLAEDLGVDPADDLVSLESAILRHDPGLDPPSPRPDAGAGNLRPGVSSFVGRDDEIRRIASARREHRLVTLIGPGGVGKTRLAVEAGARARPDHPDGVWLVDVAAVSDPDLVAGQVAATLSIGEQPGQPIADTVVAALQHRRGMLLLLDNCEHLLERCAALTDRIARSCPAVRILATSRRPLGVDGECVMPVHPLPDPDACRLFADRAGLAGTPRDEIVEVAVAPICRALDGLPLALELAAAQLRVLGPDELAARLDQRLRFVSGRFDSPPRQRTLRDTVAWSAGLLPAGTQRFFARLGVFATTMTLDAATAVGGEGDDGLSHVTALVDHSLLAREPGRLPVVRYRLLETLRLFALERLRASGEEGDARRAHARYYLRMVQEAAPRLVGPEESVWARRVEAEEPNLHAALAWAAGNDRVLALRLGVALWPYWDALWRERTALAYFSSVLGTAGADVPDDLRAWALTAMASLGANPGEARQATVHAGEAVTLFRRLSDERGLAHALVALGSAQGNEGALDAADRALDEALPLAHDLGEGVLVAQALNVRAFVATRRGDLRSADRFGRAELAAWIDLGSRRGEATALRHVANTMRYLGDVDEAARLCERALAIWREVGDTAAVAHVQNTLADVARARGDLDGALRLHEEALAELRRIGDRRCTASTYKNRAAIAATRGDHRASTALLLDAVGLRVELGDYAGLAECFDALAVDLAASGRATDAAVLLAAAEQRRAASRSVASPEEQAVRTRAAEAVQQVLPARRRAELQRRGLLLDQDQAVAFALALRPA